MHKYVDEACSDLDMGHGQDDRSGDTEFKQMYDGCSSSLGGAARSPGLL